MKLVVAIVNYRSADMVCDTLDSLAPEVRRLRESHGEIRVRVGDNGSGDDSVAVLSSHVEQKGYGDFAEVLDLGHNGGFAWGNNRLVEGPLNGPAEQRPEYVLLLNPDTVITPGSIEALLDFMIANPKADMAGSRLIDPDGTEQVSSFRFLGLLSEFDSHLRFGPVSNLLSKYRTLAPQDGDEPRQTDWVAGASLIVRRSVFEKIGLIDESYFLYFEETDFCKRAADAGLTCWYVPASRVIHLVGQTSGITNPDDKNKRLPGFWFESRKRYFVTHHGAFKSLLIDAALVPAYVLKRIRFALQRKPDVDPSHFLRDHLKHAFLTSRRVSEGTVPMVDAAEPKLPESTVNS